MSGAPEVERWPSGPVDGETRGRVVWGSHAVGSSRADPASAREQKREDSMRGTEAKFLKLTKLPKRQLRIHYNPTNRMSIHVR